MDQFCELKRLVGLVYDLERELKSSLSLTLNEGFLICAIARGMSSTTELSAETGLSQTRLSRVLSSLERKRLVSRKIDSADKRRCYFELTAPGQKKAMQLKETRIPAAETLASIARQNVQSVSQELTKGVAQ